MGGNICSFSSSLPLNNETETAMSICCFTHAFLHHIPLFPPIPSPPCHPPPTLSTPSLPFPRQPPSPCLCHHPLCTHLFLESIRVRLTSFPLTLLLRLDTLLESLLPMEPFLLPSLLSSPPGRGDVRKKRGSSSCCTPSSGSASN